MDMKKYRDIERLKERYFDLFTSGDQISITEKIDGANAAIRYDSETDSIVAQSRNNILNVSNTLRGFYEFTQTLDKNIIKECLGDDLILYMEWLVPHTVKYPEDRYHRAYVFDVYSISQEKYLDTHIAYEIADKLGIPKVPVFYEGEFISYEHCRSFVGRTELGGEYGEGVVIKGNNKSLKFVGEKFAESHNHKVKEISIEELEAQAHRLQITESIVTKARVHKILNKLVDENIIEQDWDEKSLGIISKHLPKLIFEDCVKEESETVKLVSDFGKLAAKTAMRLSREICEEKGECA